MDKNLLKLLDKANREMTRQIYGKYSRHKIVEKERLKIEWDKLDYKVMGRIYPADNYREGYKIVVSDYYNWTKYPWDKRWNKKQTYEIIKHELLHAYIKDWFGERSFHDAHPVFLAHCLYLGIHNGYKAYYLFEKSSRAEEVRRCKSYTEFMRLCFKYEKELAPLHIDYNNRIVNSFVYTPKAECGLKVVETIDYKDSWLGLVWYVSGNLDTNEINRVYKKKINKIISA